MDSEQTTQSWRDLRFSGTLAVLAHAALLLALGVMFARSTFKPPALQVMRLDLNLSGSPAAESAGARLATPTTPDAPQATELSRPSAAQAQPEHRLLAQPPAPSSASEEAVPAVMSAPAGVANGKQLFGTGLAAAPDASAAGDARGGAAGAPGAGDALGAGGVGIEGPVGFRQPVRPAYPRGAQQRGEEGRVVLETVVGADGRTVTVAVASSSHFDELDRAAVRAIERARFIPANENGRPVEARARITIVFRLVN